MITKINTVDAQEFEQVHDLIALHRSRALQAVNNESLMTAWEVGAFVSGRLKNAIWGSKTVMQLSEYLRAQDPTLRGYSRRNVYNMVALYDAYSSSQFLQYVEKFHLNQADQLQEGKIVQALPAQYEVDPIVQFQTAQFPNFLNLTTVTNHFEILNRCNTLEERIFYVLYSHKERLNINELRRCLKNNTFASLTGDKHNFSKGMKTIYPQALPMLKDTIFVDFLGLPQNHSEKKLQRGILENMKDFVLEMGKDFLFVGCEYPVQVGNSTFKIDLVFYHRGLRCLVAIELKTGKFKPEYMGQLDFYLEALDRDVRRSDENPSIGILLCQEADRSIVEYAMSRSLSPTLIAEYKRQLLSKEVLQQSMEEFTQFLKTNKNGN